MVIGLLMLAAIPTVTGMSLGISERSKPETARKERAQMRKFTLTCWCEGRSRGKAAVHGGDVVLGEGKMWIQSRRRTTKTTTTTTTTTTSSLSPSMYPFNGFYLDYPDDERPPPAPTGLVTMVSDSPPAMNWIYIDTDTWEVRHGNRTQSRRHRVGDFGWTSEHDDDFDTDPGGLVCGKEERFVAVEPRRGSREAAEGRWEVFWDRNDDKLQGVPGIEGRTVLRVSLERAYIEEEEEVPKTEGKGQCQQSANGGINGVVPTAYSEQASAAQQHASENIVGGRSPQATPGEKKTAICSTFESSYRATRGSEARHYESQHTWSSNQGRTKVKASYVMFDEL